MTTDARDWPRRRTRLQSAKIFDASGAFLCEATVQDASTLGLRLALGRNCGLPQRFGVHLDLTGEAVTAVAVWRRECVVGARIVADRPPTSVRASDRAALKGRYYGVRG